MNTSKTIIDSFYFKKFAKSGKDPYFRIGKLNVGGDYPCFITAEIGINFNGNKKVAFRMIDAAANAGCNAVKFQLFRYERMYAKNAGSLVTAEGKKVPISKIIKNSELSFDWLKDLKQYSSNKGVEFFASVCDETSADILETVDPCAYKIASYEITHIPLIKHVGKKGKPIILSIGGAEIGEVAEAIKAIKITGNSQIVLMHCIAQYNAPLSKLNLNVLKTLKLQFPEVVIGYSDHSSDPVSAPEAAIALGAKMIEKHITLDRKSEGPDHSFALEPFELKQMVNTIRLTEELVVKGREVAVDSRVLGLSKVEASSNEEYIRQFAYRMIYVTTPIKKSQPLTRNNTAILRPGENYKKIPKNGIIPKYYDFLMQRRICANKNLKVGIAISWEDVLNIA